jgi:CheY-like chemotaxis protein
MRFNMVRSNKDNNNDLKENNKGSIIYNSSSISANAQSNIDDLIVVGTIKVDEHSRLTFSKRIKAVLPIFPQDTIVVYQNLKTDDLMFKIQRYNEVCDTWIIKRENNDIIPFSNAYDLKQLSSHVKVNSDSEYNGNIKQSVLPSPSIELRQQLKNDVNILIVDDDIDVVDTFRSILLELNDEKNEKHCNIDSFCSAKDALVHFLNVNDPIRDLKSYYDLIILDVKMPEVNGVQLYQMLKIIDSTIKVLFISALDAVVDLAGTLPGINSEDILKKPVDIEHFFTKVQEKINHSMN